MAGFAAAWLRWGDWHEAYAAVTWCRAGRMPRQPWEVGNERSSAGLRGDSLGQSNRSLRLSSAAEYPRWEDESGPTRGGRLRACVRSQLPGNALGRGC